MIDCKKNYGLLIQIALRLCYSTAAINKNDTH